MTIETGRPPATLRARNRRAEWHSRRRQAGPVAKGLAAAVRLAGSEPHVASIWRPSRSFEGSQFAELGFLRSDQVGANPQETWGN